MSRSHRERPRHSRQQLAPYSLIRHGDGEMDLHRLAILGNAAAIERVLTAHGGNLATLLLSADAKQRTLLHFACAHGHADTVRVLLRFRLRLEADSLVANRMIAARDCNGNTPLHLAVTGNHLAIVSLLVWAGADISSTDAHARTPLDLVSFRLKSLKFRQDSDSNVADMTDAPSNPSASSPPNDAALRRTTMIRELNEMIDIIQVYSNRKTTLFSASWLDPVVSALQTSSSIKKSANLPSLEPVSSLDVNSLEAKFRALSTVSGIGNGAVPLQGGGAENNAIHPVQEELDPKVAAMIDEIGNLLDSLHVK
ncbi:ankyrin repeat-containing domain protein [Chytriomyces sp. MP71]|nr:ankyrin repeat-containing domain protein [Chytriomyces sp. MP71]